MISSSDFNDRKIFNDLLVHFQFVASMFMLRTYLEAVGERRDEVVEMLLDQWKENLEQTISEGLNSHDAMLKQFKDVDVSDVLPTTAEVHHRFDDGLANVETFLRHVLLSESDNTDDE